MKVIKKTESQSFVFPIQDELTENVVKFFNSLIALTIKSIIERKEESSSLKIRFFIKKIWKLFEIPAITMGIIYLVSTQNFPKN